MLVLAVSVMLVTTLFVGACFGVGVVLSGKYEDNLTLTLLVILKAIFFSISSQQF